MKLPNGQHAIVEDTKLLDYVLNPSHPVGRHHAELFERLLGITLRNHKEFRETLLQAAATLDVTPGQPSSHGRKYEMRIIMEGVRGPHTVLAVWLIEHGETRPRLITCYVE